jgi:hypothetical protein
MNRKKKWAIMKGKRGFLVTPGSVRTSPAVCNTD